MVFRRRTALARKTGGKRKFARRVAPKRRVGAHKSMVKLIKSVIHKQAENKVVSYTANTAIYNYNSPTGFNANNIIPLTPFTSYMNISQGTGQGDRIGNKVSTRKCFIKFVLFPGTYSALNNPNPAPQDIRIIIFKWKDTPTTLASTSTMSNFWQRGDSSEAPSGTLTDMIHDVNKDKYTVYYDKTVKVGYQNDATSGSYTFSQSYWNNDYKVNVIRKIDVTKWCPKTIGYLDNSTLPETPVLQMMILSSTADNTQNNAIPTGIVYSTQYVDEI